MQSLTLLYLRFPDSTIKRSKASHDEIAPSEISRMLAGKITDLSALQLLIASSSIWVMPRENFIDLISLLSQNVQPLIFAASPLDTTSEILPSSSFSALSMAILYFLDNFPTRFSSYSTSSVLSPFFNVSTYSCNASLMSLSPKSQLTVPSMPLTRSRNVLTISILPFPLSLLSSVSAMASNFINSTSLISKDALGSFCSQ